MPWIEEIGKEDDEFIAFVKNYNNINKPHIMNLLNKENNKNIIIFKNREEARVYLDSY